MTIANKSSKELHDSLVESFRLLGHTAEEAEAAANGGEGRTVLRAFKTLTEADRHAHRIQEDEENARLIAEARKPSAAMLKELEAGRTPAGIAWYPLSAKASASVTESYAKAHHFKKINGIWNYPIMTGEVSESPRQRTPEEMHEALVQGYRAIGLSIEEAEHAASRLRR